MDPLKVQEKMPHKHKITTYHRIPDETGFKIPSNFAGLKHLNTQQVCVVAVQYFTYAVFAALRSLIQHGETEFSRGFVLGFRANVDVRHSSPFGTKALKFAPSIPLHPMQINDGVMRRIIYTTCQNWEDPVRMEGFFATAPADYRRNLARAEPVATAKAERAASAF